MKSVTLLLTLFLLVGITTMASGQEKSKGDFEAPLAVQQAFQAQYPGEDDPDWHLDAHGNYESHFKMGGEKYRADYKADGTWIETENSIKKKQLPEAIKKVIEENYSHRKITEVERVDSAEKGLFYDVEFKQKGKNMDVEFKADGTIIN